MTTCRDLCTRPAPRLFVLAFRSTHHETHRHRESHNRNSTAPSRSPFPSRSSNRRPPPSAQISMPFSRAGGDAKRLVQELARGVWRFAEKTQFAATCVPPEPYPAHVLLVGLKATRAMTMDLTVNMVNKPASQHGSESRIQVIFSPVDSPHPAAKL